MPGTIRVSVLEFMDLPELLPLPILIKISMGKRQYETSEKGDFSFPLTTLRDDVILIIQDAGGNEVSRAGVQAKSIVEKGYWDDLFPLEGGGRVHLKFQFALSEDDRSRIRTMRETAMRRKQVERQDRNLNSSGSSLASSFYLNPELSDSQKCLLQVGDLSAKEAAHQSSSASTEDIPDEKLVTEKTNDTRLDQNDADRNEENPSAIPHVNHQPSPTIRSEKKVFHSQGSELSRSPAKDEKKTGSTDRKTPSMVKNVISAFESNLTQDTTPRIKPTLRSTQIGVVEKQTSLKVYQSKEGTTIDRPLARELTHDFKQNEQKRKFIEASDGTKLSENAWQSLKLKGKKNQVGGENLREKDQMNKKHDDIDAKNDGAYQKSMPEKPDYVKDEQFSSKRSGGWIFPDEKRRVCVTTGGNQMLEDMVGGRTSYTFSRKVEMKISTEESRRTSETRANRGKHDHQEMIKPESSDDVKPSEGPLANAFKIAVMIGFGTLVLLTRQRKKKR